MAILAGISDGDFNLGQAMNGDSIVIIDSNNAEVDLGPNFVRFETDPVNEDVSVNVISEGGKRTTQAVELGYQLSLHFVKSGPEHDNFQYRLQQATRINGISEKFAIQTTERFPDGTTVSWRYKKCTILQKKGGTHELNQPVPVEYAVTAEDKVPA